MSDKDLITVALDKSREEKEKFYGYLPFISIENETQTW
jgi:hypothetical protein